LRAHVATCTEARCLTGSKVSYILYPPGSKPDFERFKSLRAGLERSFQQRLPLGSKVSFSPPTMTRDGAATVFEARRTETHMNGQSRTVITRQLYTSRMAVELISSSTDANVAEANLDQFQAPLIAAADGGAPR